MNGSSILTYSSVGWTLWCIHHWLPTVVFQQLISSLIVVQTRLPTPLSISLSDLWAFWCCQFILIVCNAVECPPTCLQSAGQTHCLSQLACVSSCWRILNCRSSLSQMPLGTDFSMRRALDYPVLTSVRTLGHLFVPESSLNMDLWVCSYAPSIMVFLIFSSTSWEIFHVTCPYWLQPHCHCLYSSIRGKNAYDTCWYRRKLYTHCQSLEK